jgi:hypothetical protein
LAKAAVCVGFDQIVDPVDAPVDETEARNASWLEGRHVVLLFAGVAAELL